MTIVESIYQRSFDGTPAALAGDQELNNMIKNELDQYSASRGHPVSEDVADLVYHGSSTGQAHGFKSGFKYAVSLLVECLCS